MKKKTKRPRNRRFKKYTPAEKYAFHKAKVAKARMKGENAVYSYNFVQGYEDERDNLKPAVHEFEMHKAAKRPKDYLDIHRGYVNGLKNNPRFQDLSIKERIGRGALWYREHGG